LRAKRLLVPLAIVLNVLGSWIHWEAVVKPLLSECGWPRHWFPAPFYLFYAPLWFWHDLAYALIIAGTVVLGYYAVNNNNKKECGG
jgi:hypothetical protein